MPLNNSLSLISQHLDEEGGASASVVGSAQRILHPLQTGLPVNGTPTPAPTPSVGTPAPTPTSAPSVNSSGWPVDANGNPIPITTAQWNQLQSAIAQAVSSVGANFTNPQLQSAINQILFGVDQWNPALLPFVTQGEPQAANTGPESNKGGGNTAKNISSWFNSISGALTGAEASVPPPSTATTGSTTSTTDPLLSDLIGAATGANTPTAPTATPTTVVPTTTAASPIVPLLFLAGAGGLVYLWYHNKHKKKGTRPAA